MKKNINYIFGSLLLIIILIPQITFASWWNPFSWFTKQPQAEQTTPATNKPIIIKTDTTTPITTPKSATSSAKKITKTDNQLCVEQFGLHNYSTGVKNANGGLTCQCENNYTWTGKQCILTPPKTIPTPVTQNPPTLNTAVSQQQNTNISPPLPTPAGTLCNGKYYSSCSTGNDFICPSSGGEAFCQPSQGQKLAVLQAQLQMYQNELVPVDAEIQKYQNQYNQQCSNTSGIWTSRALGEQGQENILQASQCASLSQALLSATQQKTPILNQINYIQQQISNLQY
jgi:hypothetical protein